jgi:hypothetical protein
MRTDGRTDMTNSVRASCNRFPEAPTRCQSIGRLTLIVAFLFEVSSALPKLESEEVTVGLDNCTEIWLKYCNWHYEG